MFMILMEVLNNDFALQTEKRTRVYSLLKEKSM